jgi:hypothetical protein
LPSDIHFFDLLLTQTAQVRVCRESIWQRKVPPEMQGRIFALQRMITQLALPIAAVISGMTVSRTCTFFFAFEPHSGPITDLYFEPALAEEGLLAPVLGPYIGTGKGEDGEFAFSVSCFDSTQVVELRCSLSLLV